MNLDRVLLDPVNYVEAALIYRELKLADYVRNVRFDALTRLGFLPYGSHFIFRKGSALVAIIEPYIELPGVFILWSLALVFGLFMGTWWVAPFAAIITFIQWKKNQKNRNVDDAMRRKDRTNQLIIQNPQLLFPFISKALETARQRWVGIPSLKDEVIAEMFIFSEIDNLEFVFDKSRSGLIEIEYVHRAIKIFIARAENVRFEQIARRLILKGRYNRDFMICVKNLLDVGFYARSLATQRKL